MKKRSRDRARFRRTRRNRSRPSLQWFRLVRAITFDPRDPIQSGTYNEIAIVSPYPHQSHDMYTKTLSLFLCQRFLCWRTVEVTSRNVCATLFMNFFRESFRANSTTPMVVPVIFHWFGPNFLNPCAKKKRNRHRNVPEAAANRDEKEGEGRREKWHEHRNANSLGILESILLKNRNQRINLNNQSNLARIDLNKKNYFYIIKTYKLNLLILWAVFP